MPLHNHKAGLFVLSKQEIDELISQDPEAFCHFINSQSVDGDIITILKRIGKLPPSFDGSCLLTLLESQRAETRYWAIKNLGKLKNLQYLEAFHRLASVEQDTTVRREAVSAIGRLRSPEAVPILLEFLGDEDPKVALQAVRGLLVFKDDEAIRSVLQSSLQNHRNEMIRDVYEKEFAVSSSETSSQYPHPHSFTYMRNVAILGDVMEVMPELPSESIHLTFTSPPYYNARDYSIYTSYEDYLDFLTEVFQEVHRITKEGRFFVLNTSPVIVPRISRTYASKRYAIPFDIHARLVEIGWEFIDDIVWVKPEASVKNRNAGFLQHRKPLGYKPNPVTEYLMVYRKRSTRLIDWNMRQYTHDIIEQSRVTGDYETANTWHIDPTNDRIHPAVFPYQLCYNVVRYYSYVNDLVFDPFAGSGTLGEAAFDLHRHFFLVEQQQEYFDRLRTRLSTSKIHNANAKRFFFSLEAYREWATANED